MNPVSTGPRFKLPPITILMMAVALGVAVVVIVTLLAQQRPWLGLSLVPAADDSGAVVNKSRGPSAGVPEGAIISKMTNGREEIELSPLDLTVEPDGAMGDYATYRRFLDRQEGLTRIQNSEALRLIASDGREFVVQPSLGGRPLGDLPVDFYVQCAVGLIAWLVSAAVFAFRSGESSARYLLLSGASTLLFAPSAAIYTTRELAVPSGLLQWACDLNFLGGSLFAASFVGLLLVYPRRIAPAWVGPSVVALFVGWFVAQQVGVFESMTLARRFLVMVGVLTTFALAAVHWRSSKRDPLARAKLQWFLLSWIAGTSIFALFILLPQTFGVDTSPIQGYAFLLFLLVYGGLALGILRYRLFDLGDWWRRVVAWTAAVLLLILLDLFFVYSLHLSTGTSLAVALLVCGTVWLPLRSWLWHRYTNRNDRYARHLFQRVVDVALAPPGKESEDTRWRNIMQTVFEPLELAVCGRSTAEDVTIHNDGLSMQIPQSGPLPSLELRYARNGQSLFNPRDALLARELLAMVEHAFESLASYQKGVAEERTRIARDMHDNIGAQLLSALHCQDSALKDTRIRESLSDLRGVINHAFVGSESIDQTFADLRVETADRLDAAGIGLTWETSESEPTAPAPSVCHAIRSILREAVSNAIRHSLAKELCIRVRMDSQGITLEVSDDGRGLDPALTRKGNGLKNIENRLNSLNGSFDLQSTGERTSLKVKIPLQTVNP